MHNTEVWACVKYLFWIGVFSLPIGAMLPRSRFQRDCYPFRAMKWERDGQIYEKLRVREWKDKMPDASKAVSYLAKKKLSGSIQSDQVERLVQETCVAELTHIFLIGLGFGCVLIAKSIYGFVLSLLWGIGNLVFIVIQRYNRPVLIKLADKLRRREETVLYHMKENLEEVLPSNGHVA